MLACSTDTFTGEDAGDDGGSTDARNDGTSADGASIDASAEGGVIEASTSCLNLGSKSGCGSGSWCTNALCCANDAGAQCTNNLCNGTTFACRDTQDCSGNDSGTFVCCLINAGLTADVCPRQIKGGQAACILQTSCAGYKLCNTGSECPGTKSCERANIGGDAGISIGICL